MSSAFTKSAMLSLSQELISKISIADITFIETLNETRNSCVFHVSVRGMPCVMKVYHQEIYTVNHFYEPNIFKCETKAYRRLKERGLCKQGLVPDFYGAIEKIDPTLWKPHLDMFLKDKVRPDIVFIEYIPNLQTLSLENYSKESVSRLRSILHKIHRAGICHGDIYPRNMMVQEGSQRVLWIDFDRAQTYDCALTERQQQSMDEEKGLMDEFAEELEADYQAGEISESFLFFYEYI